MNPFDRRRLASCAVSGTKLSKHAALRSQQRSMSPDIIDAVIDFGEERHAGGGCFSYAFTDRTWRRFVAQMGADSRRLERARNAYVVVAENGHVVTTAWIH
ncbi:DUF4258 domain-containing protein [Sphingobium sp. EP60837]|uniref:DUF4258 domain-containing protein n=1 Tax=Sphingobium sp. EP60837 TaxID=1855519 RepID=UPI0007DDDE5A|nr:DUF4258 domain-containing protein [Sphingobium sp. EP60837]ANI78163.1 hypothetical protein EP837_01751 [Sphingobium sp. EP60837]